MTKKEPIQKKPDRAALVAALQAAQQEILCLENKLAEYKWLEDCLVKRTKELNERAKELECLYAVGKSLPGTESLAEFFRAVCESLPKGFQFPGSTWVSLQILSHEFSSRGFKLSEHSITCDVLARGKPVGNLIICVEPAFDRYHKTAVLPEETRLAGMVAALIGKMVENKSAD